MGKTRSLLAFLAAGLLTALSVTVTTAPAIAAPQEQTGHRVTPGQPYGGGPKTGDWLGSYLVGTKQVFCVRFEYKAPDTSEQYQPGDELKTKWGDPLAPDVAADISYLLLRYGDTKDPDEAAALAHLLHSWTSPARTPADLDPKLDFRHIAYDAPAHLAELTQQFPKAAQDVQKLTTDAETNRGPWTASITPPSAESTIGDAAEWTVKVKNAKGNGVAGVPVTLTLTDLTTGDGKADPTTVTTGPDGTAKIALTPTDVAPKVSGTLSAPADKPYVQQPVTVDTQQVVSTGGEKQLTAQGSTTARTKPGAVRVSKLDSRSGKGISGVALRITAKDRTAPAKSQQGTALTGPDGKPTVVTTGADGTVSVPDLQTPQDVCVIEVSPPDGYDQAFDPANPPSACGAVDPGQTLALTIKNTANEVPTAIPAGGKPTAILRAQTVAVTSPWGWLSIGVLALFGSALVGFLARRRSQRR